MKLGILASHPIQYHAPLFREIASREGVELTVYYAHRPSPKEQGEGFGIAFEWDIDLLSGYRSVFLGNTSKNPGVGFHGYNTPTIYNIILREKFDYFIVHGWSNRSCWQAFFACWRFQTPLAVRGDSQLVLNKRSLGDWARAIIKSLVYPWFIKKITVCLPYGQRSAEYFSHYGAKRVRIAPHFVDNDFFRSSALNHSNKRAVLRNNWSIPDSSYCFLFCGKFIKKKRPMDVIRAIEILVNTPRPNGSIGRSHPTVQASSISGKPVHLLMVGDGDLREECEKYTSIRSVPVSFAGFLNQSEIASAYAAVDCLVLSSDVGETWGLVVNEALACGTSVIVSDECGCAPDIVNGNPACSVYPCGDINALVDTMQQTMQSISGSEHRNYNFIDRFSKVAAADSILVALGGAIS